MIPEGTRFFINGVPFRIVSAAAGSAGCYVFVVKHDTTLLSSVAAAAEQLLDSVAAVDKTKAVPWRKAVARLMVEWITDELIKKGVNINHTVYIKNKPDHAQAQIRSLLYRGYSVESIVEALGYALGDSFWRSLLPTKLNSFASVNSDDGLCFFDKLHSQMCERRQSTETAPVRTKEDTEFVIEVNDD